MGEKEKRENKYFDIVLVLILLLVLSTYIDLNITLEQIFRFLTG
ncbi:MAG: hypothetical protein R6V14_09715 [Halanaerobiales bacterium]